MKRNVRRLLWVLAVLLLAVVLVVVNFPAKAPADEGFQAGDLLSDFTVRCMDGSEFTLSAHRGKTVVINLWATWCTPCVQELSFFDRLQEENPENVIVLAVHVPPVTTDVADWLSAAFPYSILFAVDEDSSLNALMDDSTVLPQTLIINPDGIVTYHQAGSLSYESLTALVSEAQP